MWNPINRGPLVSGGFLILVSCSSGTGSTTGQDEEETKTTHERIFVGTGEYSASDDWHAILRFDTTENLSSETSGAVTPNGTIPVKETADSNGILLNFAHTFYYWESRNELYVGSLFTNAGNAADNSVSNTSAEVGSIGVISQIDSADGAQTLSRHLFGDSTGIVQPHGIWIDESRDILYAANTFGGNILVFDNASTTDGNVAPSRTIDHSKISAAVHLFIDEENDRMFVANMAAMGGGPQDPNTAGNASILIYNNASTLNGEVAPHLRITGSNTRLTEGNNQTIHNVWFNSSTSQLFVGHHTNEVLIYDLSDIDLTATSSADHNLAPRVLEVHEQPDDSDLYKFSVYGFYLDEEADRLYVSCGHATNGSETGSGGPPTVGSPPNEVKVYEGVSSASFSGQVTPSRTIHWSNGDIYYPPQPIWVTSYEE